MKAWIAWGLAAGLCGCASPPPADPALDRLVARGLVQVAGFTPSDAAHVLGRQGQWSREGAVLAGAAFKRWKRMSRHLDEAAAGTWTLELADMVEFDEGRLEKWSLTLYGR